MADCCLRQVTGPRVEVLRAMEPAPSSDVSGSRRRAQRQKYFIRRGEMRTPFCSADLLI
jgi:hypothetical protein